MSHAESQSYERGFSCLMQRVSHRRRVSMSHAESKSYEGGSPELLLRVSYVKLDHM